MENDKISTEAFTQDKYYAWANEVFAQSSFDDKVSNLMGLVAALSLGYDGSVKYFYFSAQKAGATEEELLGAANIAAAASGLNVYARLPKDSVEPPE
jgi:alkylhydroperoxidase/carboxymuconolactone decarboxylase family protein YurZ